MGEGLLKVHDVGVGEPGPEKARFELGWEPRAIPGLHPHFICTQGIKPQVRILQPLPD
jgi:hypothetical protein